MISYSFGDIVLIEFPQPGTGRSKKRPALVVLDIGDEDVLLAPITTKKREGKGDCFLDDWQSDGLLRTSWLRLAKMASLPKNDIIRELGMPSDNDRTNVIEGWTLFFRFQSR